MIRFARSLKQVHSYLKRLWVEALPFEMVFEAAYVLQAFLRSTPARSSFGRWSLQEKCFRGVRIKESDVIGLLTKLIQLRCRLADFLMYPYCEGPARVKLWSPRRNKRTADCTFGSTDGPVADLTTALLQLTAPPSLSHLYLALPTNTGKTLRSQREAARA